MMVSVHLSEAELSKGARFDGRHIGHATESGRFNVFLDDAKVGDDLIFFETVCDGEICLDRLKPGSCRQD